MTFSRLSRRFRVCSSRTRTCAPIWTRCMMMRMRRQWQWQLRWEWRQQLPELLAGNVNAPTLQLQQQRSIIGSTWLLHFLTTGAARRTLRCRHGPSLKAACFGSLFNERESNEVARVTRGGGYVQGRSSISTALPGRISAVENQVCRGGRAPGLVCHSPEAVRRR